MYKFLNYYMHDDKRHEKDNMDGSVQRFYY